MKRGETVTITEKVRRIGLTRRKDYPGKEGRLAGPYEENEIDWVMWIVIDKTEV